jgi:hypothetical protein
MATLSHWQNDQPNKNETGVFLHFYVYSLTKIFKSMLSDSRTLPRHSSTATPPPQISSPTENPILLPHQNQTFGFGGALYGRYRVYAGTNTLLLWSPSYNRLLRPRLHRTLTFSLRSLQGVFPPGGQVAVHPSLLEVLPRYSRLSSMAIRRWVCVSLIG